MWINDFSDALVAAGLKPPLSVEADGKIHRFNSDSAKGLKKNGWYVLHNHGDYVAGSFGCYKRGLKENWNSGTGSRELSTAERKAIAQRIEQDRKAAEARLIEAQARAAEKAKRLWIAANPATQHDYLDRKGIKGLGARVLRDKLLIPVYGATGIVSLQFIFPNGEKRFLTGGQKRGCYAAIKGADTDTLIICEGYATGVSIHMTTEASVIIAFDAGNLEPVAIRIREKYPRARIIIAADNDQWTMEAKAQTSIAPDLDLGALSGDDPRWIEWRAAGHLRNPGVLAAQAAAQRVGGQVRVPPFPVKQPDRLTDFNDLHKAQGLNAVRTAILEESVQEQPPPPDEPEYDDEPAAPAKFRHVGAFEEAPFRVLGYNEGHYYYFPYGKMQIVSLTASGHTINNLLQLARLEYWTTLFEGASQKQMAIMAANALMAECERKGVFLQEDMARGSGAWLDQGRHILHGGDQLYVDGKPYGLREVKSRYVYVAAPRTMGLADRPLSSSEANKLREICELPTWENKLSGSLLAGWVVIAPVCAMLKWRPHIWITGEASAGKSTVKDDIIKRALGPVALLVDGGTTEAAIRQMLKFDGRPVIYDEAEAETHKNRAIMEDILQFARKSSSGGYISKGTVTGEAIRFQARSSFCFCAINPSIKEFADQTRISMLVLKRNTSPNREAHYRNLIDTIESTLTPEFGQRLLARTVTYMSNLLANVKVFTDAASRVLGNRRAADQIGPMLAGLYLLSSTKVIDVEAAEEWIRKHDWTFHTAIEQKSDQERLLQYICTAVQRVTPDSGNAKDVSIGRLIMCALQKDQTIVADTAERKLRDIGIWPRWDGILILNDSPRLSAILRETPWSAGWRSLSDLPGAEKVADRTFAPGLKGRSIRLPTHLFEATVTDDSKDEEIKL